MIRDVSTNKSRGFGFVKFKSTERAEDAIERFNGSEYLGKTLEVKFANTDGETDDVNANANAPPSDNVYVKGLPPSWSHDDLKSTLRSLDTSSSAGCCTPTEARRAGR